MKSRHSDKIDVRRPRDIFDMMNHRMFDDRRMFDMFDDIFDGSMSRLGHRTGQRRDPFEGFMSRFDDVRMPGDGGIGGSSLMNRFGGGGAGQCVSQTFVYSQTIGQDGKPKVEKYFNSNVEGVDKQGRRVGQMEEMYNNTGTGVKKIAEQRTLGDKARKIVRSKQGQGT